jgi:phage RecT family recombinase
MNNMALAPEARRQVLGRIQDYRPAIEAMFRAGEIEGPDGDRLAEAKLRSTFAAVMGEIEKNPALAEAEPRSLLRAVIEAAQLGLRIGTGEAHLVPLRVSGEMRVNLWPDYKGLINLAWNSAIVRDIRSEIVCEHDEFEMLDGGNFRHRRTFGDSDCKCRHDAEAFYKHIRGAWVIVRFTNGGEQPTLMDWGQIESIRGRPRRDWRRTPWATDPWAMAKKTVLKQALKLVPRESGMAPNLLKATLLDDHVDSGEKLNYSALEIDMPTELLDEADAAAVEAAEQLGKPVQGKLNAE